MKQKEDEFPWYREKEKTWNEIGQLGESQII